MGNSKFSDDFKHDAVHQITKRGYSVADVSRRLEVSTHSLYAWVKRHSKSTGNPTGRDKATGVRRLKTSAKPSCATTYVIKEKVVVQTGWHDLPGWLVSKLRLATNAVHASLLENHLPLLTAR